MNISLDGTTLVLEGDFDVRSTWLVRKVLRDLVKDHEAVVVDLSRVPSVDHTALKVLAFASRRAHRAGRTVRLRGCRPQVVRMLHLTRLMPLVVVERDPSTLRPIA